MGSKLMMVKVVFEYFIEYFKKGETDPYTSYTENHTKIKAFDQNDSYEMILRTCRKEIESVFNTESTDTDEKTGEEFIVKITYYLTNLTSYQILAEEN
jgi:hypothetical protein